MIIQEKWSLSCQRIPQTRGLIFSPFWSLEIQGQGVDFIGCCYCGDVENDIQTSLSLTKPEARKLQGLLGR
jgi:hypothetical protein